MAGRIAPLQMTPTMVAARAVVLGLAALAVTGCAALQTTRAALQTTRAALQASAKGDAVLAQPNGGTLVMRNGAPLVISLSPDPTTGYGWVLKSTGPNLMAIGGPDYMQDPKPPGMLGVSGATTFRFRAKSPGTATIEFAWVAPPGQPPAPEKVVRYDVTITPTEWFGVL